MKYIVASIGRCGSNLLCRLIVRTIGAESSFRFYSDFERMSTAGENILKTHAHFKNELNYEYRAIFIFDKIEDIIRSLYYIFSDADFENRFTKDTGDGKRMQNETKMDFGNYFITKHLNNLKVKASHIKTYALISSFSKELAFLYLVLGDKFRCKENMESWKTSNHVMFVDFTQLCLNKTSVLKKMSDFLGLNLPDFEAKERDSKKSRLPYLLKLAIRITYNDFEKRFVAQTA